jgi:hypothetical protein
MKHLFLTFLSTAAVCAAVFATPAAAQVAGNWGYPQSQAPHRHHHLSGVDRSYMTSLGYPWTPRAGTAAAFGSGPAYATRRYHPVQRPSGF